MTAADTPPPDEARPDEVEFTLAWTPDGDTALRGELVARNVGERTWRLTGKPGLVLIDDSGHDLGDRHVVTLEFRLPGYAVVAPGGTARAVTHLAAWDGTRLGDSVGVTWSGHRTDVRTTGPRQPASPDRDSQTSSSWFVTDTSAVRDSGP